jgi:hypothetical protein
VSTCDDNVRACDVNSCTSDVNRLYNRFASWKGFFGVFDEVVILPGGLFLSLEFLNLKFYRTKILCLLCMDDFSLIFVLLL